MGYVIGIWRRELYQNEIVSEIIAAKKKDGIE